MSEDVATTRPRRPRPVPLSDLAGLLAGSPGFSSRGDLSRAVTGMTLSSRRVLPGDLYAALPGTRAHGADFAAEAVAAGAVALLTDPSGVARSPAGVPLLVVDLPREPLGRLAAAVYGRPAEALRTIGVTGTQGKTTTTWLAAGALQAAGVAAGVVGTVGTRVGGLDVKTPLTTPEAPDLHGLFAMMRERGVAVCTMEVSSHALVLGRVDGVVFDVAVFLNLGRDHLDFHRDLEDYFSAKASLFTPKRSRRALVNVDDDHGRRLAREATVPVRTFSATAADADWRAVDVELGGDGCRFGVEGPGGLRFRTGCRLPGAVNVANALAAVAACGEAGLDAAAVGAALWHAPAVPGRFESVDAGQDFSVVVDYAHKPDAVAAAIHALRPLTAGRVLVVLGAGGDRDPGKRPLMGEVAGSLADLVVVTDDNPRREDPSAVRAAVLAGARLGGAEVLEVGDRAAAITEALRRARPGDVVLIAGKGHEAGQEVGEVVHPFDDRQVARAALASLGRGVPR